MRDFKGLKVWQKSHDLVLAAYLDTVEYEQLVGQATEVKRMLTSFIQRLKADS